MRPSYRLRDLAQMWRVVGIEAAMPREGFDKGIEGGDERQRVGQRMAGRGVRQVPRRLRLRGGRKAKGALPCEAVDDLGDRVFRRVTGCEREDGEPGLDDAGGAVDDFGGRIGLGVEPTGLLEFEGR